MINISYNNTTKQLDKKILKFSTYLKFLNDEKSYAEEPLPLLSATDDVFDVFVKWFNVVCKNYYLAKKSKIFYVDYFEEFDVNVLFNLFNFAIGNQIQLLTYTIAKTINSKIDIYEFSEKWWYTIKNEKFEINGDKLTKHIYSLPFMTKAVLDEVKDFKDRYCKENDFDYVYNKENIPQKDLLKLYKLWADAKNKLFTNPNFVMMMNKCGELIYLEFTDDDTVDGEEVEDFSYDEDDENLNIKFEGHTQIRNTKFTFKQFIDIINDEYREKVEDFSYDDSVEYQKEADYKWLFISERSEQSERREFNEEDEWSDWSERSAEGVNNVDGSSEGVNNVNMYEQRERSEQSERSERSDDDSSYDELDFE